MKKFKFFALAFAALSFAACSDDVIDSKGGNAGAAGDGTPAYLTISFSANGGNSSRSTADDANNYGDQDGDPDDSGHNNEGTTDEQAVKMALIVVNPADGGNTGFAKLYTTVTTDASEDGEFELVDNNSKLYHNAEPIQVAVGKYNVLVVINPVKDLLPSGVQEGITNANEVQNLYNKIINESYLPDETTYKDLTDEQIGTDGLMMASKDWNDGSKGMPLDYSVEVKEENTDPDKPAKVIIEVERVMSKITFRDTEIEGMKDKNIYPVTVHTGVGTAATVRGAILDESTADVEGDYRIVILNKAKDVAGHDVYALYEKEKEEATAVLTGVYTPTTELYGKDNNEDIYKYKKLSEVTNADDYVEGTNYVANTEDDKGLTLELADMGDPTYWYVKLEGYALVNLSKDVHYVRHTIDGANTILPFGTLDGSNFLYTTNWIAKNTAEFVPNSEGEIVFTKGNPNEWFYNTLADVSDESKLMDIDNGTFKVNGNNAEYYKPLSSLGQEGGKVDGEGDKQHTGTLPDVGKFMAYCFENSTDINHQLHGLSTGISFVASMYTDKDCTQPVERLYEYVGQKFTSLEDIQKAFGESRMSKAFNDLVTKEKGGTPIDKDDLTELAEAEGGETITIYNDNICYYYTTEIKHFDNGDNADMGNMEFAIMRNNIYSLSVRSINEIGDDIVDPTPNKPDEDAYSANLDVEVKIVPWIVRYNDIEF